MAHDNLLKQNAKIIESFLDIRDIDKQYKAPIPLDGERSPYGYIYCIENKISHKKYIGSTYSIWVGIVNADISVPLRKRASSYIYEYNHAKKYSTDAQKLFRPIIQAMVHDGIENFIMYPIAETTKSNHSSAELYFIDKFDAINNGYNVHRKGGAFNRVGYGRKLNAQEKKLRSEPVVCINLERKQLMFSDSMKLFADYIGTSKDMIKNVVRLLCTYKGWFVIYDNANKRRALISAIETKSILHQKDRSIADKRIALIKELSDAIDMFEEDYTKSKYFSDFEVLPSLEYK